jgi:hypothetical protein
MRTLVKSTLGLSFIGAVAIGPTVPVQAQGFYLDAPGVHIGVGDPYYHRRYYNYSGGWRAHGMDVRRIGPFRAASVSPIGMVHGTMDTDGIVNTLSITLAPALSCGRGHFYFLQRFRLLGGNETAAPLVPNWRVASCEGPHARPSFDVTTDCLRDCLIS